MSQTTTRENAPAPAETREIPAVRVDGAHALAGRQDEVTIASRPESINEGEVEDDFEGALAAAGGTAESQQEQLQLQAAELAAQLQARLLEVDRREAHLNAQLAQLESSERISRLWQRERQFELEEREAEIERKLGDLQARAAGIAASEANLESLDEGERLLAERAQAIQTLENQLREQRQNLDREAHAIRHGQQMWEQFRAQQELQLEADRRRLEADFEQRKSELEQQSLPEFQAEHEQLATETTTAAGSEQLAALQEQYKHLEAQLREQHAEQLSEAKQKYESLESELRSQYEARHAELTSAQQRFHDEQSQRDASAQLQYEQLAAELIAEHRERQQRLDDLHRQVDIQRRELQKEITAVAEQRQAFQQQSAEQREAFLRRVQAAEAEIEQRRTDVIARESSLDRQQEAIEQVRAEIAASQGQILEMRLVAEQLWAQVTGRLSSTEVTQSIAQLRLQLAEHYRLQQDSLLDQKNELLLIGERVQLQHQTLFRQREDLKSWACTQQAEIERQAQRLVTRELELDEQQQHMERIHQSWLQERRRYEQQISDLVQQRDRSLVAA